MNRKTGRTDKSARKSPRRERLIIAMLQQPDLEKAAASVGMSTSTAYRIRKTPEFEAEYQQARRDAVSQSTSRLQQGSGAAVSTMLKTMLDPKSPPAIRLRAADRVMEHAQRSLELEDYQKRLRRLEERFPEPASGEPR